MKERERERERERQRDRDRDREGGGGGETETETETEGHRERVRMKRKRQRKATKIFCRQKIRSRTPVHFLVTQPSFSPPRFQQTARHTAGTASLARSPGLNK